MENSPSVGVAVIVIKNGKVLLAQGFHILNYYN